MKKTFSILVLFFAFSLFSIKVNAIEFTTLDISTNKTIVKPEEEIELNIDFGQKLTSYSFNILYDKNLVEYVSTDGGVIANTTNGIIISYNDLTNSKDNMKVIFKGKEDIITSNPTNFAISGSNLQVENSTETYDDIVVPIIKNFIVEPEYDEYKINLDYTGDILKNQEKDMNLTISSDMGRPYEHARIIIETVKPTGATVQLLGIDENGLKHDMIQSGWGDASGYPMGGKNIAKILNLKGVFNTAGNYTITVKMIDRENSDSIISQKAFPITVKEMGTLTQGNNIANISTPVGSVMQNTTTATNSTTDTLLKTGSDGFFEIFIFTAVIVIGYLYLENKRKNN